MRGSSGEIATRVAATLRRLLRPIVRFALREGITYPILAEEIKSLYVKTARSEFRIPGALQTDSRIQLLTGVNRKELRRRSGRTAEVATPIRTASLGAQLAAKWASDPTYTDETGRPVPLARSMADGGARSFEGLVQSVSKDIRSRSVLDEWMRLGVASLDDRNRVVLNPGAFVPAQGTDEKLFFFERNVHDHFAAAVHNLAGASPTHFERGVHYEELASDSIAELTQLSADLGMQALLAVNRHAAALERRDAKNPKRATMRVCFGAFFYREPATAADTSRGSKFPARDASA